MSKYIAKFEELCKFSTIYQRNPNKVWKCIKFEGGLREDILTVVGPMDIRVFPTLLIKIAKFDAHRKRMALETRDFEDTLPSKQQFQFDWYEDEQP